jgi:RNA polymerase sigma-70 factor (ECF subfamily)
MGMVAAQALAGIGSRVSWPWENERGREATLPPLSPEAALARSAAQGDKGAFSRLVEAHKRPVYGLCVRLLADAEEARDAAQETFVRAYAAMPTFDPSQPFAPWLLRIARNLCLDQLRRRLPARARVELDADPEEGAPADLADTAAPRADDSIERAQTGRILAAAVASLPPNYREVVHLFHVEQLSYKEIAATLGVPMGTVMTWLHRARAKLRQELEGKEVAP